MNKRIRELATQVDPELAKDTIYCTSKDLEKFVELIVQECIEVGHNAFLNDNSTVPIFPSNQIKQHFGVEE